jgi:hypothetical protein
MIISKLLGGGGGWGLQPPSASSCYGLGLGYLTSLLRRGFNEPCMALTVSNRCVEDAQAETGKAGSETSARSRSKKC